MRRVKRVPKQAALGPVKPVMTYQLVAEQITRAIHLGLLLPGERLPAERALAQQLRVARMTVREAMRVLEQQGQIVVRRGKYGGVFICSREVNVHELTRLAADTDRAIADIWEFRAAAERISAGLAAKRATPADVRQLRRISREMDALLDTHLRRAEPWHIPEFLALDCQFHGEIARVTRNPYVCEMIEKGLSARHASFGAAFRELSPEATKGHDTVVNAIAAHDSARAEKIMGAHVSLAYEGLTVILKRHVCAQKDRAGTRVLHGSASRGAKVALPRALAHRESA
jgi:GntR family transcriptional repressor for pyruvate dehydrogenase complex